MAITPTLESFKEQLLDAVLAEMDQMKGLAAARQKREELTAIVNEQIKCLTQEVEQIDLAARFRAGDKTVECDPAAGNGGGGYREINEWTETPAEHMSRKASEAANSAQGASSAQWAADKAQWAAVNPRDAAMTSQVR